MLKLWWEVIWFDEMKGGVMEDHRVIGEGEGEGKMWDKILYEQM